MGVSGPPKKFPYDEQETKKRIELYKKETDKGNIRKPCWTDFLARNEISVDEATRMIKDYGPGEKALSETLKKMQEWCIAQLFTADAWGGGNAAKAIFLSKQDFGLGGYSDRQDVKTDSRVEISVKFGGKSKDPFK